MKPSDAYSLLSMVMGALAVLLRVRAWGWLSILFLMASIVNVNPLVVEARQILASVGFVIMTSVSLKLFGDHAPLQALVNQATSMKRNDKGT